VLPKSQCALSVENDFADGIYLVKLVRDGKMIDQLKAIKTK